MSSSMFPFLRSLLVSPLKSDVRTTTIQQTIQDRDRGGFTTPDRQQVHLSFHDTNLRGIPGAIIILEALATNPFASQLTISHNKLGDIGIHHLSERIRLVKNRRSVPVYELNLASNSLTNFSLRDLCGSSWQGLSELYLSNNQITLEMNPSPMLHLAHLTLLSLTSNPINCQSISNIFRDPNFVPLELTTLHLSACHLDLNVAVSLALWLEDKLRSGKLEWLAVNGNDWGTLGCERITWALARKEGNCNLLRLEMLACGSLSSSSDSLTLDHSISMDIEEPSEDVLGQINSLGFRDFEDFEHCRLTVQFHKTWNQLLDKCELRNQALRLATRRAALGLVSSARLILLSSSAVSTSNQINAKQEIFPWNRLPEEIKLNIWRWVSILSILPKFKQTEYMTHQSLSINNKPELLTQVIKPSQVDSYYEIPDPLSAIQIKKIIQYAQDRSTLEGEIFQREEITFNHQIYHTNVKQDHPKNSSIHRQLIQKQNLETEIDQLGKSAILKSCDCQRFLGSV